MIRRPKRTTQKACQLQTRSGLIEYLLVRSTGRRNLTICIDEEAEVKVSIPFRSTIKETESFIHEKAKWIIAKLKEAQENKDILAKRQFESGEEFLFLGKKFVLNVIERDIRRSKVDFDGNKWTVILPRTLCEDKRKLQIKTKLIQWYRKQAEELLGGRIFHYSRVMGITPKKIAVRSQKRIWGNCDFRTQTIHLNWQIILSPLKVIDYVIVHEMCHLIVPDHSKRFWRKVEKFMPDFDESRKWLKTNSLDMILP